MVRPDPSVPDPDAWTLFADLPSGAALTCADLHARASGVSGEAGPAAEPFFWDEEAGAWWSLGPDNPKPVSALVWIVDLAQLAVHPEAERRAILDGLVLALNERLEELDAKVRIEESVGDALLRLPKVLEKAELLRAPASVVVVPPAPASVGAWWQALEAAGLNLGDDDAFWIDAEDLGFPEESFEICAEPKSTQGYFHPDERDGDKAFPDVTLSFPISAAERPAEVVPKLVEVASRVAAPLDAKLTMPDGTPFSAERTMALIERVQGALSA